MHADTGYCGTNKRHFCYCKCKRALMALRPYQLGNHQSENDTLLTIMIPGKCQVNPKMVFELEKGSLWTKCQGNAVRRVLDMWLAVILGGFYFLLPNLFRRKSGTVHGSTHTDTLVVPYEHITQKGIFNGRLVIVKKLYWHMSAISVFLLY